MFVHPLPIPNIESLSQYTILSLDSVSFDRNRSDVNIQQQTTLEVADTEALMADNEEIDPTPLQGISNVFAAADLPSRSSSYSYKYKLAWLNAKVIHCSFYRLGDVQTHAVEHYQFH